MRLIGGLALLLAAIGYLLMVFVWPILMQSYREAGGQLTTGFYCIFGLIIVGAVFVGGLVFGRARHE